MTNRLFRRAALERLSTPDRLDELMIVTTIRSWLMILPFVLLTLGLVLWATFSNIRITVDAQGYLVTSPTAKVASLQSGIVSDVLVTVGQSIEIGQPIITLNLVDTNTIITVNSPHSGTVLRVNTQLNDLIVVGSVITEIETVQGEIPPTATLYISADTTSVLAGQSVEIAPDSVNILETGVIRGTVTQIYDENILTRLQILQKTGEQALYETLDENARYIEVIATVSHVDDSFIWSLEQGEQVVLQDNETVTVTIITNTQSPFEFLFSG